MIDTNGETWVTVSEAARIVRVRESAIHTWVHRGKVRSHRLGRRAWVNLGDVRAAEAAWTHRIEDAAGVKPGQE